MTERPLRLFLCSARSREPNRSQTSTNRSSPTPYPLGDQWDNLDGRIERRYAGRSNFFESGSVRADLSRAARMRASRLRRHQRCTINNVTPIRAPRRRFPPQLVRVANIFRPWASSYPDSAARRPSAASILSIRSTASRQLVAQKSDEIYAAFQTSRLRRQSGFEAARSVRYNARPPTQQTSSRGPQTAPRRRLLSRIRHNIISTGATPKTIRQGRLRQFHPLTENSKQVIIRANTAP